MKKLSFFATPSYLLVGLSTFCFLLSCNSGKPSINNPPTPSNQPSEVAPPNNSLNSNPLNAQNSTNTFGLSRLSIQPSNQNPFGILDQSAPYGPDSKTENEKMYYQRVGETYAYYEVAEGWFDTDDGFRDLCCDLPFCDDFPISVNGNNHYRKYKNGKPYTGKINETLKDGWPEKLRYRLNGYCRNGLLHGKIKSYEYGQILVEGQLEMGNPTGLWKYYYQDFVLKTFVFVDSLEAPVNIKRFFEQTTDVNYSSDYRDGLPLHEVHYYQETGDTLSVLSLVDSAQHIYNFTKFHPNGKIMETGKKQLNNPTLKQVNTGTYFRYKWIGIWKYFDESGEPKKWEWFDPKGELIKRKEY